jgi:hypothetical protein
MPLGTGRFVMRLAVMNTPYTIGRESFILQEKEYLIQIEILSRVDILLQCRHCANNQLES